MKYLNYIKLMFLALIPIAMVVSCSKDDDAVLKLSDNSCAFDHKGGVKTIMVATDKETWEAKLVSGEAEHFILDQQEDRLVISALENNTTASLSASIEVKAGNSSMFINVTQAFATESRSLEIFPNKETLTAKVIEHEIIIVVKSVGDWVVSSDKTWCKPIAEYKNNRAIIKLEANDTQDIRTAEVTFQIKGDESIKKTITINQNDTSRDPYFALTGMWDVYCNDWIINDGKEFTSIGEGSFVQARFRTQVPYERFTMTDMYIPSSVGEVYFNPDNMTITIPLGWQIIADNTYSYCLLKFDPDTNKISDTNLIGKIAEDFQKITFEDVEEGWSFGIFGIQSGKIFIMSGVPYPANHTFELRRSEKQPSYFAPSQYKKDILITHLEEKQPLPNSFAEMPTRNNL